MSFQISYYGILAMTSNKKISKRTSDSSKYISLNCFITFDTRRRFNVHKTFIRRLIDVELTSCVYWDMLIEDFQQHQIKVNLSSKSFLFKFYIFSVNSIKDLFKGCLSVFVRLLPGIYTLCWPYYINNGIVFNFVTIFE